MQANKPLEIEEILFILEKKRVKGIFLDVKLYALDEISGLLGCESYGGWEREGRGALGRENNNGRGRVVVELKG